MMHVDDIPKGYIAGWASTKDLDYYQDVVVTGAFDESISAKGLEGPKGIKLLVQHDSNKPAGIIKVLETRDGKLWIEAQMNMKISYVRDMYEAAKMQGGLSFSVGFFLQDYEWKDKEGGGEYFQINRAELTEVSIVTFPGNPEAEMTFIKGITDEIAYDSIAEFEKALVALGLAKSRNDAQRFMKMVKRNTPLFRQKTPLKADNTKALNQVSDSIKKLREALEGPSNA